MPRHRDGFLLSSWPDNPAIGTVEGIGREEEGRKTSNMRKGEKKKKTGEAAGARRLRPAPAYSSRMLRTARAGDEWDLLPIKIKPFL